MKLNCYNVIISTPFDDLTLLESAEEFLKGFDFSQCDTFEEDIKYVQYVDTYDGVDLYYDYGADYYFFVKG